MDVSYAVKQSAKGCVGGVIGYWLNKWLAICHVAIHIACCWWHVRGVVWGLYVEE